MRWSALLAALALPVDALACGGFFCNTELPIEQAAEQIVFGIDPVAGEVTVHVEITYSGAAEDFAWIVPVASPPSLFVSSDALFTAIAAATQPEFRLRYESSGTCRGGGDDTADTAFGIDNDVDDSDTDTDSGVTIISEQTVGPYETVVLQATGTAELLGWLQGKGYDLPDALDPVLQPYVASGQYFVALRLSAGKDTGDLAPLGMRYPGTAASVPIQLTSIAATPDMRLQVYVLGDARSVPDNYLHVTINEAAIDWFNGGRNYDEVISLAADEAGGHAFATDHAGPTAPLRNTLWNDSARNLGPLRTTDDPFVWLERLMGLGLPPSAALLEVLLEAIPFPAQLAAQGVRPQNFYDCLSCYAEHVDAAAFSGATATAVLEARLIDGLREAERLFAAHPHMTRMTSSLDAAEMTVDPVFVYNRDLPQAVSSLHEATVIHHCATNQSWEQQERTLVLSDGRQIRLPSIESLREQGMTELQWMGDLTSPKAILIEDYGAEGLGEVLFDYRDGAARSATRFGRGCGCDSGPKPFGFLALGLVALGVRRRRR